MFHQAEAKREIVGTGNTQLCQGDSTTMDLSQWRGKVQCVYMDPPFMTGEQFLRRRPVGEEGWRTGKQSIQLPAYTDKFPSREAYLDFLRRLCDQAKMLLAPTGMLALHLDWRSAPYGRMICDQVLGEKLFMNEIIWAYESGGRSMNRFSRKHDTILLYARSRDVRFDISRVALKRDEVRKNHMRREVDEQGRAFRSIRSGGKVYRYYDDEPVYPGDVWTDISHLQQRDPERTGYTTQKPQKLLERILLPVTQSGELVADLCCGSGTTLAAAQSIGCRGLGIDQHGDALSVTAARLKGDFAVDAPTASGDAVLDAVFDPDKGMVTLMGFTAPGEWPQSADPLAQVEQWSAGRLRSDGTFYAQENLTRSYVSPGLPVWALIPEGEGEAAVRVTDARGRRWLFKA